MSIYTDAKAANLATDNHESDLYLPHSVAALEILRRHGNTSWSTFTSQIDGKLWIEIPLMFDPFWERVSERARKATR